MGKPELSAFLKAVPMFAQLSAEHLSALALASRVSDYAAGEFVDGGDWAGAIWLPVQGLIRVTSAEGPAHEPVTMFIAGRGDLVGCFDPQCARRHDLQCVASAPSLVARLPRAQLLALVKSDPQFASSLIHMLNERLWEARELRMTMTMAAEKRLARTLITISSKLGQELPLTRRALADLSGLARETTIRALGPLERSGIVRSTRGTIGIVHLEKLEKLARS